MYVTRITCENLRTISEVSVDLCVPTPGSAQPDDGGPLPNVTLLLGVNGSGKTTILRAIALAALAPLMPSSGYAPRAMVRRTTKGLAKKGVGRAVARLRFTPQDGRADEIDSEFRLLASKDDDHERFDLSAGEPEWAKLLWKERSPACFLVGYGASRRVDAAGSFALQMQEKQRSPRFLRVAGLFEDSVVLRPLSSWLPQWDNPGRRKQLVTLFNEVLDDVQIVEEPKDGQYLFRMDGTEFPFDALSDGYRALIGWIADLLYHISRSVPSGAMLFQTEGIVLIDEIDLHLHPTWQKTVIPRLARAMPNLQFVLTSHSPLVVGSLHRENVRIVRRSERGTVVEAAPLEVFGLSADQILTSEYFGLKSTRQEGFAAAVAEVAKQARSGDPGKAQQFLRMLVLGGAAELDPMPSSGGVKEAPPSTWKKRLSGQPRTKPNSGTEAGGDRTTSPKSTKKRSAPAPKGRTKRSSTRRPKR
ncbi:MAG: AAA family ATPase [Planctomycetota bacterium]|jgi:hypothetical protein